MDESEDVDGSHQIEDVEFIEEVDYEDLNLISMMY